MVQKKISFQKNEGPTQNQENKKMHANAMIILVPQNTQHEMAEFQLHET